MKRIRMLQAQWLSMIFVFKVGNFGTMQQQQQQQHQQQQQQQQYKKKYCDRQAQHIVS